MQSAGQPLPGSAGSGIGTPTGDPIRSTARPALPVAHRLAKRAGPHYGWIVAALSGLGAIEVIFHANFFATLIPTLRAELSLSYSLAQSLLSAFALTYGLMQIPVGLLTDRFGARRVALVSLGAFTAGAAFTPFTNSYAFGLAARLLVGLGASAVAVPGMRLISAWLPSNRASTGMGVLMVGSSIGGTLALALVPVLSTAMGWRLGYSIAALTLPFVLLLFALLYADRPEDVGLTTGRPTTKRSAPPVRDSLRRVLGDRGIWVAGAASALYYGSYHGLIAWTPTYLMVELSRPATEAGALISLMPASGIVVIVLTGLLSDRLGRWPIFLTGALGQAGLALAFVALAPRLPDAGLAAFMILFAVAGSGYLNGIPLAVQQFEQRFQGTATGVANGLYFVGAFLVPILLGVLVDRAGEPHAAFFGISALSLAGFVVGYAARNR
ncbi:MAG: MFS transporter [Chloroflexi bacterium]|nr:MFS transporter [Chloroflexota bacterium]